ncbi:MAG: hypothetical protein P1V97_39105, partial [Planctomycetota bacterium]|nr:hypothetical protein [Planctomycetota bacterium]
MLKRVNKNMVGFSLSLFILGACQKNATTPTQKTVVKTAQAADTDEEFDETQASIVSGSAGVDDDRILFLAPFRLHFKELPSSQERLAKGASVLPDLLTNKSDNLTSAQTIVSHGPSALKGFMDAARTTTLSTKHAQQVLSVLAYMPKSYELEELYESLRPTELGRQAEQQLLSMKELALQFLLEKIDSNPTDCPALVFRISKALLADADFTQIDTFLMQSKGPGRWSLLELTLSVRNRIANRRIKESLFFGSVPDRLKAIRAL